MNTPAGMQRLAEVQALVRAVIEPLNNKDYRAQFHSDLSPPGWHFAHCSFIETYWLREQVMGDASITGSLHTTYFPEQAPSKYERGQRLPEKPALLDWANELQQGNCELLSNASLEHPLLENDYLLNFLIQHYCQHYETLQMVLTQRALQHIDPIYHVDQVLEPADIKTSTHYITSGEYQVGTHNTISAYDNELPPQAVVLGEFEIADRPVSNAEYLGFMLAHGYTSQALWSDAGWQWCNTHAARHPDHWRQDARGHWYQLTPHGPADLVADDPVSGINLYEANAFIHWARQSLGTDTTRLPHEYEWETARRQMLDNTGAVWEWCCNTFHPYAGFNAFPYDGYSKAWFDDKHYTLRGGSHFTQPEIERPGFRNFFNPDKRHMFSGMRLVM